MRSSSERLPTPGIDNSECGVLYRACWILQESRKAPYKNQFIYFITDFEVENSNSWQSDSNLYHLAIFNFLSPDKHKEPQPTGLLLYSLSVIFHLDDREATQTNYTANKSCLAPCVSLVSVTVQVIPHSHVPVTKNRKVQWASFEAPQTTLWLINLSALFPSLGVSFI